MQLSAHAQQRYDRFSEQRYLVLADSMPQMVWATDAHGSHFYYNRRWYEYTGLSEEQSLGFGFTNALHPDDIARTLERWERAWRDGEHYEIEYRFRRSDGVYQWFIGRALPVTGPDGMIVEWVGTCTNIDEQKRTRETLSFLAEASALLSASLDYEATLAQLVQLAVPQLADWAALDICEPDGSLRRLALAHADPTRIALARELERRQPFDPDAPNGVAAVLRTGEPELIATVTPELVRAGVENPELREILLALDLRSSLVVPLKAHGRILGALTLVTAESHRQFTPADLALVEELALRAAIAIDNARLYHELSQFKTMIDLAHEAIIVRDAAGQIRAWNRGAEELYGWSGAEAIGQSTHALFRTLFPSEEAQISVEQQDELLRTVGSWEGELIHRRRDGSRILVESRQVGVKAASGAQVRVLEINRDVTARRQVELALRASEQRYRALADAMPLLVWLADQEGGGVYYNQRWLDYTGLTIEQAGRSQWFGLIHPDDQEICARRWSMCVTTGDPFEVEYRFRRHDGVYRWQLVRAVAISSDDSRIAYWVGTNTDIDERKQTEVMLRERSDELARTTRLLEDRNRELDQFAYITSHDLKAPLRGIANLSQWIEEDLGEHVTEEVHSQLELLRGRVHRMEALIDGILHYSRVGRVGGAAQPVDVGLLLEEVVDLLAPPPNVQIAVASSLPTIVTEKLLLQQVFSNLIGNAIKHHPGPEVQIRVGAQRRDGLVEFSVADNGPGIAPQYHERIFGIFQTLASRDRVEGSGLGLALVKKIIAHQRGQIWLASDEGQGATFYFTWPDQAVVEEH